MTTMLVVDTSTRDLEMFTANVSRSATGLVVRPALRLPGLAFFARGSGWRSSKETGLPVLLLGDGYQARSSAGFVELRGALPWETYPVIGYLGDHGLRVIRPRTARLLGPVRVVEESASTNSNCSTADAVLAGLPLLTAADPRAIIIAEGQSDAVGVYRLLPADPQARSIAPFSIDQIEEEFRTERFNPETVATTLFRRAYRYWAGQGVIGPIACATNEVVEAARRIGSQELDEFLRVHLGRGDWQFSRRTTWEITMSGRGRAGLGEGAQGEPVTVAQATAAIALANEGKVEEANELWRQSALELDLPIEAWERPLLGLDVSGEDGIDPSLPEWERELLAAERDAGIENV